MTKEIDTSTEDGYEIVAKAFHDGKDIEIYRFDEWIPSERHISRWNNAEFVRRIKKVRVPEVGDVWEVTTDSKCLDKIMIGGIDNNGFMTVSISLEHGNVKFYKKLNKYIGKIDLSLLKEKTNV